MPVNKKVLIIEDDAVQVRLLTVRLKAAGFDVAVASDATMTSTIGGASVATVFVAALLMISS